VWCGGGGVVDFNTTPTQVVFKLFWVVLGCGNKETWTLDK
jgi:hypothetical protein